MAAGKLESAQTMVEVRALHKYFGSLHVLKGVDLTVQRGEVVVFIGRSGSGKSTLLRCINYLEPYDSGEIRVDNELVSPQTGHLHKLRESIGIVFQQFNLFPHLTALDNVTLAPRVVKKTLRDEAEAIGMDCLRKVGLEEKARSYPDQLSGGQQQRVAIARCLAMNPKLMLLDEITSALDPELIAEVLTVLEDLAAGGMTMIIVTHEMGFARRTADRICFLHDGVILEEGDPQTVFTDPQTEHCARFIRALVS